LKSREANQKKPSGKVAVCYSYMTYGENIVSVCQDNTGTDEIIENNVNL